MFSMLDGLTGTKTPRPPQPGVWAPMPTFFLPDTEELGEPRMCTVLLRYVLTWKTNIPTFRRHMVSMAEKKMGIVVGGSMGEAHHCTPAERILLVQEARQALDAADMTDVPILAGTGMGSTKATIELTREAVNAGADAALVIASGYYAGAIAGDRKALKKFWMDVCEKSPIPVMIYNYPGASGGINLDSDVIEEIGREAPNSCGVKLTCGDVGKLTRICATVAVPSFAQLHPRDTQTPFLVLGGFADFLVPSVFARGHGAIMGLGNISPRVLVRCWELAQEALRDPTALEAAQQLQDLAARGDRTIALAGISGTKELLNRLYGYGGAPRRPLLPLSATEGQELWDHENVRALLNVEMELEAEAQRVHEKQ
ncbi:aldolase [Calocera cornea HHB12733]|uniref:Aldolase n=1 Tax=Calocera cornea HHB12733 TaxID=1353952 RepID=A0A165CRC9_9BASI|nr:aldolase [Calocera cornea HHB12733]